MIKKIIKFLKKILQFFPSKQQWRRLPSVLNKKERYFILGFLFLIVISLIAWIIAYNTSDTIIVPKQGGEFKEGIVGSPQYLNPVLGQVNDADRDVNELIFSGLMKYNGKGELIFDLAESYAIGDKGKVYEFFLKKDIKWHDNQPFTADDVVFTILTIQNPEYRSPLRINWTGVQVEKVDDWTVRFTLNTPYAPFLANTTIGIIAKHVWENILPESFSLALENLSPIGTGPYKMGKIKKDNEGFVEYIQLELFEQKAFIEKIHLYFYPDEESLIRAYNKGVVDNINLMSAQQKSLIKGFGGTKVYKLNLPRYFAVFFNQSNSKVLSDKNVRLALNYATNKEEIINQVLGGEARPVNSPLPEGTWGHTDEIKI